MFVNSFSKMETFGRIIPIIRYFFLRCYGGDTPNTEMYGRVETLNYIANTRNLPNWFHTHLLSRRGEDLNLLGQRFHLRREKT